MNSRKGVQAVSAFGTALSLALILAMPAFAQAVAPGILEPTQPLPLRRSFDANAIAAPPGFRVDLVAAGLNYVTDVTFSPTGEMYVAESGDHTYGTTPEQAPPPRILQVLPGGQVRVVFDQAVPLAVLRQTPFGVPVPVEGLIGPVTGVTWHNGLLYVSHRTRVSVLDPQTGAFQTLINGLPAWGFFHNYKVIFGPDGRMYFFVSTQGNAGPIDEHWMRVIRLYNKWGAHEIPCEDVVLTGRDFAVPVGDPNRPPFVNRVPTGVYVPLGVQTFPGQVIPGQFPCNGAFYRANPDGSGLEVIAWGLRSDFGYRFSPAGQLIATQNSGNPIPPREIHDDFEPIYQIVPGAWYGWPDYYSSIPIIHPRFARPGVDRDFVLTLETHRRLLRGLSAPIPPLAVLPPHTAAEGLVFGLPHFGMDPNSEILVAEFGAIIPHLRPDLPGFKVQRVNLLTGAVSDFLVNRRPGPASATGGGGLERPIQLEWGPNGALYVVDFGVINITDQGMQAVPNTGAIWRVSPLGL